LPHSPLFEIARVLVRLDHVALLPIAASFRVTSSRTLRITRVSKERKMEIYERSRQRNHSHTQSTLLDIFSTDTDIKTMVEQTRKERLK